MEIRQREVGTVVCVDVDGRLVVGVDDRLKDVVKNLLSQGNKDILLNMQNVSRIDTSGLAAITAIRAAAQLHDARVKLVSLPPRVHDLLVITKLITMFEVFESEDDAVESFDRKTA